MCLAIALVVLGPIYAAVTSADFANCQQNQGQYPTAENKYNKVAILLVPAPSAARVLWRCVGGYSNSASGAITALSALLLLFVTGILGWIAYRQYTTTRAQLRAYVFVESASIYDGATPQNAFVQATGGCPYSRVIIKNFGQTPAVKVRHVSRIVICQVGTDDAVCVMPPGILTGASSTTIGPGATTSSDHNLMRALTQFEISALQAVGQALFVYGLISYEDVFGISHQTTYRLGYAGGYPPHPQTTLLFADGGNNAN